MFTLLEKQTIFNHILDSDSNRDRITVQFLNNVATELGMTKDEFEVFCNNLTNLDEISNALGAIGIFNDKVKLEIYNRIMGHLK